MTQWRSMRPAAVALSIALLLVTSGAAPRAQSPAPPGARVDALSQMADEVAAEVEQLRGWTFKRPVLHERVDAATARRYLQRQIAASLPPARQGVVQAFLRTSGLIPPDCDLASSLAKVLDEQVAGYYDPHTGTLYLVDRPDPMPTALERAVVAHELTHALDDQQVGIATLVDPEARRTQDADVVLTSLGEGSATSLMTHFLLKEAAAGKVSPLEFGAYFAREMRRAQELGQNARYFNAMFGSYLIGAAFLAKGDFQKVLGLPDDRLVGENFVAAWKTPPRSSEQILHPEKYWDPAQADEPIVIDDRSVERWLARPGRQVIHRDTLGELLTALLTEPRDFPKDAGKLMSATAWTNPGAIGWGGDRFYLLAAGPTVEEAGRVLNGVKGVWITAWDGARERARFLDALEKGYPPPGYAAERVGVRTAIIFIGFDAGERAGMMKRLVRFPLRMTRAGRAVER